MKKYIVCVIIMLIAVVSCREEAIPKPDDLLSKERMAAILYDITLVNSIKGVNKDKLDKGFMHLDTYLFHKHETDSAQFQRSNNYYAANPEVYREIYGIVEIRLAKERKEVGEKLEAEQKRKDSLREADKIERVKRSNTTLTKKEDQEKANKPKSDG